MAAAAAAVSAERAAEGGQAHKWRPYYMKPYAYCPNYTHRLRGKIGTVRRMLLYSGSNL